MPKVSVAIITYNHEAYIRQAVESVLRQVTDFAVQVVIGEDCSTDATKEILLELDRAYPGRLELLFNDVNLGMSENAFRVRQRCTGEYLALLDGDNYWTATDKLQRQVDFLDSHPEYIGAAHQVAVVDRNGDPYRGPYYGKHKDGARFSLKDAEAGYLPGQIGTWLFRNIFKQMRPDQLAAYRACHSVGDSKLALLLALYGDIYIDRRQMSAFRLVLDGDSFSAHSYRHNLSLDYLDWIEAREQLAATAFGRQVDYRPMRYDIFCHSVILLVKRFNRQNWQIYRTVSRRLKNLRFKHLYVVKKAFQKLFNRG